MRGPLLRGSGGVNPEEELELELELSLSLSLSLDDESPSEATRAGGMVVGSVDVTWRTTGGGGGWVSRTRRVCR